MRKYVLAGVALLWGLMVAGCRGGVANGETRPAPPAVTTRADLLNYEKPLTQVVPSHPLDRKKISLKIEKSAYRLTVFYAGKPVKAYPVVFGRNPVDDKRREGDFCTPEGHFRIVRLSPSAQWGHFMLLNYPTAASWRKFRQAKADGTIPANATVGSAVGIHSAPGRHDDLIENRVNWTFGCIALKSRDMEELSAVCRKGTPVRIVH